jgi:hypothetical protein
MPTKFEQFCKKVEAAANGNYYIQVVKKEDEFKFSNVKISSYIRKMSDDNDYIYISSHRLSGNIEHVKDYLKFLGCKEGDIETCLSNSYNVGNYEEKTPDIEAEISSIPKKDSKKKAALTYEELLLAGQTLKTAKNSEKDHISEGKPIPGTPLKKKKLEESLLDKLYNLPDGMALDITFFKPSTQTGVKKVRRTKNGAQRSLGSTLELDRLVFDFEFDSTVAVKFLQAIGKSDEEATEIVEKAKHFKPSVPEINLLSVGVKK